MLHSTGIDNEHLWRISMISSSVKKHRVSISCPKCRHEVKNTLGYFTSHKKVLCPGCGVESTIDSTQFESEMKKVDKLISDFSRDISSKFR